MSTMPGRGRACRGAAHNCEILIGLDEIHAERCAEVGITVPDGVVPAMAVGLVIEVWRNGPVEAMHASRRGPTDAAMFAESTALHNEAVVVREGRAEARWQIVGRARTITI